MRSFDSHFGLGFLLSLGHLPLVACTSGDDGNDTNATTASTVSTTQTTSNDSTGDDGGTGSATNSTTASTTNSTTASTTNSTTVSTTDATGTGPLDTGGSETGYAGCMPEMIPPECTAYADKIVECYPDTAMYHDQYVNYCACNISVYGPMYGANCSMAYSDYYACMSMLTCDVLMGMDPACDAENTAVADECFGGSTTTDATATGTGG